jgi:hypothetical protein
MNRPVDTQPITGARALIAAARPIGPDGGLIARATVFQAYAGPGAGRPGDLVRP